MNSAKIEIHNLAEFSVIRSGGNSLDVSQSRGIIATDLRGATLYNKPDVLDKLLTPTTKNPGLPSMSQAFVDSLVKTIETSCAEQLKEIETLESQRKDDEEALYDQIDSICEKIEEEVAKKYGRKDPFRRVVFTGDKHEPIIPEIPTSAAGDAKAEARKPDYVVADVPLPKQGEALSEEYTESIIWRQCPSFMEVKAKAVLSPVRQDGGTAAKNTLAQGFDYAHFIFTERPFQRFVYGTFFCGNSFCVGYFDRCGIALTPLYKMQEEGLRNFILVILRMTHEMTAVDLGMDPNVEFAHYRDKPAQTFYQEVYPEFIITDPSDKSRSWHTYGDPLYTRHSIIGRGTTVWRTYNSLTTAPSILKVIWRSSRRTKEALVYEKICARLDACGATIPSYTSIARKIDSIDIISVTELRSRGIPIDADTGAPSTALKPSKLNGVKDRTLSCIWFPDFGRPVWQYRSPLELLRVMYQVIKAHKTLSENGVLHRDISAGNILIRVHAEYITDSVREPRPRNAARGGTSDEPQRLRKSAILEYDYDEHDAEGILTDFEFASIDPIAASDEGSRLGSRDGMSGTPMFMATELLNALINQMTIPRTAKFDLESFGYVILNAIYRNTLHPASPLAWTDSAAARKLIDEEYENLFGFTDLDDLKNRRGQVFFGLPRLFFPREDSDSDTDSEGAGTEKQKPWRISEEEREKMSQLGGILHLYKHLSARNNKVLAGILKAVWTYLRTMQPQFKRKLAPGEPPEDTVDAIIDSAVADISGSVPVQDVDHNMFLHMLERLLTFLGDQSVAQEDMIDEKTRIQRIQRAKQKEPRVYGMYPPAESFWKLK
ncbi:hypothetical protein C8Q80DRAFT_1271176 [Daedaleopsis nitida]|nr:hypothetical protein C8Q80DRAFT_1271176 [Daedaleopsis nitida]